MNNITGLIWELLRKEQLSENVCALFDMLYAALGWCRDGEV